MSILKTFQHLPIRVIGVIVALHSAIYGIGYIIPTSGFASTALYKSVIQIMPDYVFGTILLVVGVVLIYAYYACKDRLVEWFSNIQSVVWLFAALAYWFDGLWLVGLGIGMIWSILSAYTAFSYRMKERTINELIRERLAQDR